VANHNAYPVKLAVKRAFCGLIFKALIFKWLKAEIDADLRRV